MFLVLFQIELNKFGLEVLPPGKEIFYKSKITLTSKKRKDPHAHQDSPSQWKGKTVMMDPSNQVSMIMKNYII